MNLRPGNDLEWPFGGWVWLLEGNAKNHLLGIWYNLVITQWTFFLSEAKRIFLVLPKGKRISIAIPRTKQEIEKDLNITLIFQEHF